MKPSDFPIQCFTLATTSIEKMNILNWCDSIGMTPEEIEIIAKGGSLTLDRIRYLFEKEIYKRMFQDGKRKTKCLAKQSFGES